MPNIAYWGYDGNNATDTCNAGTAAHGNCKEIARGCWDGYGQLNRDYVLQNTPHLSAVWKMVAHLSGLHEQAFY